MYKNLQKKLGLVRPSPFPASPYRFAPSARYRFYAGCVKIMFPLLTTIFTAPLKASTEFPDYILHNGQIITVNGD